MSDIKIGVQLYSVRDILNDDLAGTLKKLSKMGYDGVEFFGEAPASFQKLKALLDENNLECCGWHFWGDYNELKDEKTIKTIANQYKIIENNNLIVSSVPEEYRGTYQGWIDVARNFNQIGKKLKKYNINLGYHNHDFEFKVLDGEIPWEILFDNTNSDILMQLDTGNAYKGGGKILDILKKYSSQAKTIHLKPYSVSKGFKTVIGEDDLPWKEIFEICEKKANTEWYMIEYESEAEDPLMIVDKCLQNTLELMN